MPSPGGAVLLATHDSAAAARAGRIVRLRAGKVEEGARPGSEAEAADTSRGIAIVDLASGLITSVEADLNVPAAKGQFKAGGILDMKLKRGR